jgi:hypothetical protein
MRCGFLYFLLVIAIPAFASEPQPTLAGARARYVYESRMSNEHAAALDTEDDADEDIIAEDIGLRMDVTYNSAARRGGSWAFAAQCRKELADDWALSVFGQVFPNASNTYSELDCGCGGSRPKETSYNEEDTVWQAGIRLEWTIWENDQAATILFSEVAGPGLVSQRGMEFLTGLQATFELTESLSLHGSIGGAVSTATLDQTRNAYAMGNMELDYTTSWLPNDSDRWFVGSYAESGDIIGEGAYVLFYGGFAFAPCNRIELEVRGGTELASPYDERAELFVQVGISLSF